MNTTNKVHITVRFTNTGVFRAFIQYSGDLPSGVPEKTEVTVGGKEWKAGKCLPYQSEIIEKCQALAADIMEKANRLEYKELEDVKAGDTIYCLHFFGDKEPVSVTNRVQAVVENPRGIVITFPITDMVTGNAQIDKGHTYGTCLNSRIRVYVNHPDREKDLIDLHKEREAGELSFLRRQAAYQSRFPFHFPNSKF